MKIRLTLPLFLLLSLALYGKDFRFMALSTRIDPTYLLGSSDLMERNYSLSPWPWDGENTPFTPGDEITDLVFNQEGDLGEAYRPEGTELLFLERIHLLTESRISLSFLLTEEVLERMRDSRYRSALIDNWSSFPCDEVIWDPHLSPARKDFESLVSFIAEWGEVKGDLPAIYSMGRQDRPIPFLWDRADYVIIEAYDFSGRHSTYENAEEAVENFIVRKGRNPELLILGIPLYGRKYKSSDPEYWVNMLPYDRIVETYHPAPETNEVDDYYFNGPLMGKEKTSLAKEKGLGGIALYPIEWDSRGSSSLEEAVAALLRQKD